MNEGRNEKVNKAYKAYKASDSCLLEFTSFLCQMLQANSCACGDCYSQVSIKVTHNYSQTPLQCNLKLPPFIFPDQKTGLNDPLAT